MRFRFKIYYFFLIMLFFIFTYKYIFTNLKEPMTNSDTIVLIGDSILNNNMYVPVGKSVADNIKLIHGNNIIIGAKDNATIDTCYYQLNMNNINNSENYFVFISIGGNDILNNLLDDSKKNKTINKNKLENLKKKYIKLVKFIEDKYPKAKIHLLNLYFPSDEKYKKYEKSIIEWNKMIENVCLENKYSLLRIDNLLKNPSDFTNGIEPSVIGSEKIAKLIVNS